MNPFAYLALRLLAQQTKGVRPRRQLLLGVLLFTSGTALYVGLGETIVDTIVDWQMQLKEGNLVTSIWRDLPFPLTLRIHVFELLNGEAFQEGRERPLVRDVGPFYFNEYRKRTILEWPNNGDTVKFFETLSFEFVEEKSVTSLNHQVTTINTPLLLIMGFINSKVQQLYLSMFTPVVSNIIYIIFRMFEEKLVETRSIEEILVGRKLGILRIVDALSRPLRSVGIDVPSISVGFYKLEESTFGFIHLRHNQTFGPAEVYTGQTPMGSFNSFHSLEGNRYLDVFKGTCQKLLGTEGTFFGARPPPGRTLYLFNQHLCRPFDFIYTGQTMSENIYVNTYRIDDNMFSMRHRKNWCFCPVEQSHEQCDGLFAMSQCLSGTPMVMSNVHFYKSPHLTQKVRGLQADPERHTGFARIDSVLGNTVNLTVRVQLNVDMKPYRVPSLNNFQPVVMPYIWIEEGAQLRGYLLYLGIINSIIVHHLPHLYLLLAGLGLALSGLALARLVTKCLVCPPTMKDVEDKPDPEFTMTKGHYAGRERIRLPPLEIVRHHAHRKSPESERYAPSAGAQSANLSRRPNQVHPVADRSAVYQQQQQQQQTNKP